MRKYNYILKTLSALALSPRDHQGFYVAAGDFRVDDMQTHTDLDKDRVNIIYPFYQYGSYSRYDPKTAQYYIPGSSLKGAIRSNASRGGGSKLLVDDIAVDSGRLLLCNLYKLQNLSKESDKSIKLDIFFPNVAVEMLAADTDCRGELFSDESIYDSLREAQNKTKEKLNQLLGKINVIFADKRSEGCTDLLEELSGNIKSIISAIEHQHEKEFTLLMGGYKGLALSGVFDNPDFNSAVYLDVSKKLPHGLVHVILE
jgi:hypothetical protein